MCGDHSGILDMLLLEKVWQAVKGNFRCSSPWHQAVCCFLTVLSTSLCSGKAMEGGIGWQLSAETVLPFQCSDPKCMSMKKGWPCFKHLQTLLVFLSISDLFFLILSWHWRFKRFKPEFESLQRDSVLSRALKEACTVWCFQPISWLQHNSLEREKTGRSYL